MACYAAEVREFGPADFLYLDGELLFGHGHRRVQVDGWIAPAGTDGPSAEQDVLPVAGVRLQREFGPQNLTLFASGPLTDEDWRPLREAGRRTSATRTALGVDWRRHSFCFERTP